MVDDDDVDDFDVVSETEEEEEVSCFCACCDLLSWRRTMRGAAGARRGDNNKLGRTTTKPLL